MNRQCTISKMWPRLLVCTFLFLVTNVGAQEVGTTLSKEGGKDTEPELRKEKGEVVKPFSLGQSVAVKWQLLTQKGYPSKIGVLLDVGPTVTVSEDVNAEITNQVQKKVIFTLKNGTMRVLEVSKGGAVTTIETTDKRGKADPQDTEYIVSCGPSEIIADPNLCLYLSVQGRLNVTGGPAGTLPVSLNSGYYTYVRQNQPPTPPLPLPNPAFLQRLLDETTIVGTGQQLDRLVIEAKLPDPLQLPPASWPPESPGPDKRLPFEDRIPGYPIREFEFPSPPSPPSFP
jgi:hypothetical protein